MQPDRTELLNRLRLIEEMMAEGRRTTTRHGWVFLLWGIGPLIAMLWEARWPKPGLAWPVVLAVCVIVNGAVLRARRRHGEARTMAMRSAGAVWTSVGVTALLLGFAAAWSGTVDLRSLYVLLFALAAVAHGASSVILRWWPQFLAAVVWWAAALAAFVAPADRLRLLAASALLLGNVGFGAWLTWRERSHRDE